MKYFCGTEAGVYKRFVACEIHVVMHSRPTPRLIFGIYIFLSITFF